MLTVKAAAIVNHHEYLGVDDQGQSLVTFYKENSFQISKLVSCPNFKIFSRFC